MLDVDVDVSLILVNFVADVSVQASRFTLSRAHSTTSHMDNYFLSNFHFWEVLLFIARLFLISWGTCSFIMHECIYLFNFNNWVGWFFNVDKIVSYAIHNLVAIL